jgi:hypothetical protein
MFVMTDRQTDRQTDYFGLVRGNWFMVETVSRSRV